MSGVGESRVTVELSALCPTTVAVSGHLGSIFLAAAVINALDFVSIISSGKPPQHRSWGTCHFRFRHVRDITVGPH